MAWEIEITAKAAKQIKKFGHSQAQDIALFLRNRIAKLDDPRQLGKPLKGSELGNLWRYRAGNYRILCELQDNRLLILVVEVGHRRNIYQ